jgi:hypothetical protein
MSEMSEKVLDVQAFEEILACNIKDVVADLCLADPDILISYANNQLHGNMDEIITSSAELIFKDKTLSYAYAADVSSEWGHPPCVVLDMEFVHGAVSVFFKLVLGEQHIGVHINRMLLDGNLNQADFDASTFDQVLTSARLQPLPLRFQPSRRLANVVRH